MHEYRFSGWKVARLLALGLLVFVVVGCSPGQPAVSTEERVAAEDRTEGAATDDGGGGGGGSVTATFVAVDIAYSEAPTELTAGDQVFELVNEGNLEHDVVIEELGDVEVVRAMGGETATGEVTLQEGSYTYYCSIPGHRAAGMEGTLQVSA